MLSFSSSVQIFLATHAVDFRKAHDGLIAIVRDEFGDDPFDGSVFLFLNRRSDRVKILHWDRDGFWLHYKRLEEGQFRMRVNRDAKRVQISRPQLTMLLDGIDLERKKIRKPFDLPQRMSKRGQRSDQRRETSG